MKALQQDRIGRYELLIELGRGGMAELFLGRLHGAGGFAKLVAIKRILPHLAQDKQFKEMFLNEGRIAAHLSHPNVCQVFELEETDDELFLAMEYMDGVSWDHLTRELAPGTYAMRLAVGVIAQACEGLHYAHVLRDVEGNPTPVVHRDVSPQNLFVTVDGVCKVLDFGVSKMMTDGPRTRSGVIKGKLPYMAPEQIRGEPIDGRADVFAIAVCAWEALTGQRLFDRPTDFMIWKAITEEDVPAITTHWPECPPALDAVIRRALDRDPARRQPTARAFAEELRLATPSAPCGLGEIGDAVRTRCGDRLADRARQVASVISARRAIGDLDAAETLERGVRAMATSMEIRQGSVTLDLRRESRVQDDAAPTRDLHRDVAETRAGDPPERSPSRVVSELHASADRARPPRSEDSLQARHRSHLRTTVIVAVLAAAVTAAIVVSVMMVRTDREPPAPAPAPAVVAEPDAAPMAIPAAPPDDDHGELATSPIDDGSAAPTEVAPVTPTRSKVKPTRDAKVEKSPTRPQTAPPAKPEDLGVGTVDVTDSIEAAKAGAEAAKQGAEELRKAGEDLRRLRDGLKGMNGSN